MFDKKFFHGAPGIEQDFQAKHLMGSTEKFKEAVCYLQAQWLPPVQVDDVGEQRRKDLDVLADLGVTQITLLLAGEPGVDDMHRAGLG